MTMHPADWETAVLKVLEEIRDAIGGDGEPQMDEGLLEEVRLKAMEAGRQMEFEACLDRLTALLNPVETFSTTAEVAFAINDLKAEAELATSDDTAPDSGDVLVRTGETYYVSHKGQGLMVWVWCGGGYVCLRSAPILGFTGVC